MSDTAAPAPKLFLLDAFALIYRSHFAFSKNPRVNSKGLNTGAILGFTNTLVEVLLKEKPTHIGVCFDAGKTFRHEQFRPIRRSARLCLRILARLFRTLNRLSRPFTSPF